MIITDEYIDNLFEGSGFGEITMSSTANKRKQLHKNLRNQIDGYWSGHTAYFIMVRGGFLIDGKRGANKRMTTLGEVFMREMEDMNNDNNQS